MSTGKKIIVGLLLVGAVCVTWYITEHQPLTAEGTAKPKKTYPQRPTYIGKLASAQDWKAPAAALEKLRRKADGLLSGTSAEQVEQFLKKPENRLIVADMALLLGELNTADSTRRLYENRRAEAEKMRAAINASKKGGGPVSAAVQYNNDKMEARLAAIREEAASPHTLSEVAQDPKTAPIIARVADDLTWANQIWQTGDEAPTGEVLATLALIQSQKKVNMQDPVQRDIATACAVEYALSGWARHDAAERAAFFAKSYTRKYLNTGFASLPFWLMRNVCGLKGRGTADGAGGNDTAGSIKSLDYSQKNVHLPAYRYTGACWQAPYRLYNIYGDIVHNSDAYFGPFEDTLLSCYNSLTRNVGGVCGALSHYGATSAVANGVPALTAGEPSHCSYIVLTGDTWTPGYSLSWRRGLHWQVFRGNNKYSALHLAGKLFSPEERKRTTLSQSMRILAEVYAQDAPKKAGEFYAGAVKTQPLNYYAWRNYAKFLSARPEQNARALLDLCSSINCRFAPAYPEMAAELLKQHVFPGLAKITAVNKAALQAKTVEFWKNVHMMGPDEQWDKGFQGRWDVEALLTEQLKLLHINPQKDAALVDFVRETLRVLASKPNYTTVVLAWATSLHAKADKAIKNDLLTAMISGAVGSTKATDAERESMLNSVILAAEAAGDMSSFNSLTESLPAKYTSGAPKVPAVPPFPGKLVSQGGMILASSTSNFDHPCAHHAVLEPGIAGAFHTAKDNNAWVKVTLPRQARISGVVLRTTTGNLNRLNNMVIQVSETGNDNDWHDVAQLGECKQQVMRADLSDTKPTAKYVRILRRGGPEFFHLLNIYVYGEPVA